MCGCGESVQSTLYLQKYSTQMLSSPIFPGVVARVPIKASCKAQSNAGGPDDLFGERMSLFVWQFGWPFLGTPWFSLLACVLNGDPPESSRLTYSSPAPQELICKTP